MLEQYSHVSKTFGVWVEIKYLKNWIITQIMIILYTFFYNTCLHVLKKKKKSFYLCFLKFRTCFYFHVEFLVLSLFLHTKANSVHVKTYLAVNPIMIRIHFILIVLRFTIIRLYFYCTHDIFSDLSLQCLQYTVVLLDRTSTGMLTTCPEGHLLPSSLIALKWFESGRPRSSLARYYYG